MSKTVTVTTAVALSAEQKKQIKKVAAEKAGTSEIELIEQVDPAIIGGIQLKIGSRLYDASVAHKLAQLQA